MKTYAAIFTFVPDILERRQPYREAHLKHFYELRDAGKIIMSGPWANPYDGALVVFRAESQAEVERLIQDDIYYQAHLWTDICIREWDVVIVTDVKSPIKNVERSETNHEGGGSSSAGPAPATGGN